jgi:elongation factor Tu
MPRGFLAGMVAAIFGKRPPPAPGAPSSSPRPPGEPFEFEVEDVFTITGRGTVATGRITRGRIAVGDEIAFRSPKGDEIRSRVGAIEAFRKTVKEAGEGETVGLLLAKAVPPGALVRGVRFERG